MTIGEEGQSVTSPPGTTPRASSMVNDWRIFLQPRYRRFHGIALMVAMVSALVGDGPLMALLLTLGTSPWVATAIAVLPVACSAAQLLVPGILGATDGNLRQVTALILLVGETRGYSLAIVTALAWANVIPPGLAIALVALIMAVGGAAATIGGANLLAWYRVILPEPESRLVVPRILGLSLGLGAVILFPTALLIEQGLGAIGILVYAIVFAGAGTAGLVEVLLVRRLPPPGRVSVPLGAAAATAPSVARFVRVVAIARFGAGFGPYISIYAISVLGLAPAFAVLVAATGSSCALVGSTIAGSLLGRGSSSRMLRNSYWLSALSMFLGLVAAPSNPLAWLVLLAVAGIGSGAYSAGTVASTERLMRLAPRTSLVRAQGRFMAESAAGHTIGQASNAALLASLPLGYPLIALLFGVSGLIRLVTAVRLDAPVAQPPPADSG